MDGTFLLDYVKTVNWSPFGGTPAPAVCVYRYEFSPAVGRGGAVAGLTLLILDENKIWIYYDYGAGPSDSIPLKHLCWQIKYHEIPSSCTAEDDNAGHFSGEIPGAQYDQDNWWGYYESSGFIPDGCYNTWGSCYPIVVGNEARPTHSVTITAITA